MFANPFLKDLWDQRKGVMGWGLGIATYILAIAAIWPSFREMPGLAEFLANYPEVMRELFNLDALVTPTGFLNAELYSFVLPALFLVFSIGRGARLVAGEEEAGTLEILAAMPIGRLTLLVEKAGSLLASVALLGLVTFASSLIADLVFGLEIGPGYLAGAAAAMTLLGICHGMVALGAGAITGRRSWAITVATGFAAAGYLLYAAAKLVKGLEPWRVLSPFHHTLEGGPVGAGLPAGYAFIPLIGLVLVLAALPRFHRRDIRIQG
jgi:ABC-2 type transport system permease protein